MIDLTLAEVAEAVGGRVVGGDGVVRSVTTDSRRVGRDALFVPLRGEHADGHDYLDDAVANGAVAVLAARPVDDVAAAVITVGDTWRALADLAGAVRARVDPTVVAITGSVGKTTTKDLTAAALGAGRRTVAARGSYNNELGVPLTLLEAAADTEALVVEIGARGVGHIASLAPTVAPDVAVVTAVAGVHLELFGDLAAVRRAKRELVEALGPQGTAVLNGDDPRVTGMADGRDVTVLRYGLDTPGVDVAGEGITLDRLGRARFHARTPWGDVDVALPVVGRHQVSNALAALTCAGHEQVPIDAAAAALATAPVSAWRGEVVEAGGVVVLNDAYNANPAAVAAALDSLRAVARSGASWAVLGVMAEIGPTHTAEHRRVGRLAVEAGVDHVVVVGEKARGIAEGVAEAGAADRCVTVPDAAAAAQVLAPDPGDVVLVKASRVAGLERVAAQVVARLRGDAAAPAASASGPVP